MIQQLAYTLALLFMAGAVPFMIREPDEAFRPRRWLALLWAICGAVVIGHLSAWGVSK
tara:strand:- start:276 stop:449 length:174 start_codon:yes stop_codon:yes gene_type:complete